MRVIFERSEQGIRVTGFEYESKYSLKFEQYHLEQWYKFRDGSIESQEVLQHAVVDQLLPGVAERFRAMVDDRGKALEQSMKDKGLTFDEII